MSSSRTDPRRRWREAAEGLVVLSDAWNDARVDRATARRILRCDEETLDVLCEHGLPAREQSGEQSFGNCDVMNLGLASGTGRSVPELAQRQLLRFASLPSAEWVQPREWAVKITAECSCADDERPLGWSLASPAPELYGGATRAFAVDRDRPGRLALALEVRTHGRQTGGLDPAVSEAMAEMLADVQAGRLRFHYLPAALRVRPREAVAEGLVDCVALSMNLAERLADAGLRARARQGHLLSGVGVEHAWLEVGEPGHGAAMDPMLAMLSRSAPEERDGFTEFCVRSLSNRVLPWDRFAGEELFSHAPAAADRRGHGVAVKLSARTGGRA